MKRAKPANVRKQLFTYHFSTTDLDQCVKDGFELPEILNTVESLLDLGVATEGSVRDVFFEEKYPDMVKEKAAECFIPKPATDFSDSRIEFLWKPYLPIGDFTVLMASGGTAKSYMACGIASAVSTSSPLPGDDSLSGPGQTVLYISAEDSGSEIKRRLRTSDADLSKVLILDCKDSDGLNISRGFSTFRNIVMRDSPRLVILYPWHAFLGEDVDINRVNVLRPILQHIANLAKECNCSMSSMSSPVYEEVLDEELEEKTDVNTLFKHTKYKFEIFNNEYRFRLFVLNYSELYPISLEVDGGILEDILYSNNSPISSDDELKSVIKDIFSSKKVHTVVAKMLQENHKIDSSNKNSP